MRDHGVRLVARHLDTITRGQCEVFGHLQSSRVVGRGEHDDTPAEGQSLSRQLARDEEVQPIEAARPWAAEQQLLGYQLDRHRLELRTGSGRGAIVAQEVRLG